MRSFIRSIGMLPVLIILGILIQAAGVYFTGEGRFLTWQNLSIVAQQASINAVLGAGMTFVILTGGIDLSVGSILAASAVVALLASQDFGYSRDCRRNADRPRYRAGQRRADRVPAPAAVHRDPRLVDRRTRPGEAAGKRHDGVQRGPAVRLYR